MKQTIDYDDILITLIRLVFVQKVKKYEFLSYHFHLLTLCESRKLPHLKMNSLDYAI